MPRNVSSTDMRSHDYMFERHNGDQLTRGPQDKVLKRANQRPVTLNKRIIYINHLISQNIDI